MHTRKLLVFVSLILSVAASTNPSMAARGGGGGGHSSGSRGVSAHSSGGGHSSAGHSRGFFHGGRGYGYGRYGDNYDQANSGMWGEGPTWGSGGGAYAAGYGNGGTAASGYVAPSYAPEQLVKNYSWPDSNSRSAISAPSPTQPAPAGKAAKAGSLDDLIRDTSKY